jgi:predicted GNAT family N-acyltransferase
VLRIVDWPAAQALAMPVRTAVFVAEQGVPWELEHDEFDAVSRHALAWCGGDVVGTGRLLPDGHVGRMAVLAGHRGRGIGSAILRALLTEAHALGMHRIELHAQLAAVDFYRRHGFQAQDERFLEAGIVHVLMRHTGAD